MTLAVYGLVLAPGRYFAEVWLDPMVGGYSCDAIFDYPLLSVVNKGLVIHQLTRSWGTVYCKDAKWRVMGKKENVAAVEARLRSRHALRD